MLTVTEEKVWTCIRWCQGQENAVTSKQISDFFNIDRRTVRQIIHNLRTKGLPIASSSTGKQGYFIPINAEEATHCINQLKSRVKEITIVIRALEMSYQVQGQMKL